MSKNSESSDPIFSVTNWLDKNLVVMHPTETVAAACRKMHDNATGAVLVAENDSILGIFSERDLLNRVIAKGLNTEQEQVATHMTKELMTLDENASPDDAMALMLKQNIRHIPVLKNSQLCGVISARDLLRRYYNMLDQQNHDLRRKNLELEGLLHTPPDDRIALILEQNEKLRRMAMTDELTGLYNNRHFQMRLNEEVERARRYNYPVSLLFADVDYFKQYNDLNGHVEGDNALRAVGRILQNFSMEIHISAKLRKTDIVARYGGEEFVVLLPYTTVERAIDVGERLRKSIYDYPFKNEESLPDKNLTISIGIAGFPSQAQNAEELVRMADSALYQAKNTGRNRVCRYSPH